MLIDRSSYQNINHSLPIILQSSLQRIQSCFTSLRCRFGELHLQFVFRTIHDAQFIRLSIICRIDNTEICLNIHCFTMISSHFRRSINNGCTKFQHGRIRKSFENYFISYSVDIPMSNTNSYLVVIFHLYYILYIICLFLLYPACCIYFFFRNITTNYNFVNQAFIGQSQCIK